MTRTAVSGTGATKGKNIPTEAQSPIGETEPALGALKLTDFYGPQPWRAIRKQGEATVGSAEI